MERKKSLLAATIISATLLTGAVAYAASSGVLEGRDDNVGNLQPTAIQPTDVTIYVDPATGSVSTKPPAAVTAQPSAAVTTTRIDDSGHDSDDGINDGDRRHGRGSDDD